MIGRSLNIGTKLTELKRHDDSYEAVEKIIKELPPEQVTIYRRGKENEGKEPVSLSEENLERTQISNLRILKNEREKSNNEYSENGFRADFETIQAFMKERNAPKEQEEQLTEIQMRYILA